MSDYREKLQNLLRELFQFDSADLDFGFYAVMNQKRDVIDKFIAQDLPKLISDGLTAVATQSRGELEADFRRARQTVIDSLGETAFDGETLQPHFAGTPAGKAYLAAKEKLDQAFVPEDVEAQIYNDLYTFFSRYYQDGDFISQRRYGASDKYAVPYNGEEVHLHWANFDQYYVKSGVHFQNYSFVVPGGVGLASTSVQVRLTKVDVPRDNVRGEKRFFVYAADQPVSWDEETQTLIIPMEYRPLTPEESSFSGTRNQQERLLEAAHEAILKAVPNSVLKARLMEVDPDKKTEKNRLMYHLNRYAAENTRDFFVHKDLGNFLRREFDYYLKAEVLRLEDIDFSSPIFAERKAAQLKTTRQIGEAIIRFLDQLERFQKQLFLKRKFVIQSDYCMTLDKIPAEKQAEFYPRILTNERQLAEWEKLYGVAVTGETNLAYQPHLMLDTVFFERDFKYRLLGCFEDLDADTNGLLINSENYQALHLLFPRYNKSIRHIYIDPPYNTGPSEIIYKNNYKHSSWISLMSDRFEVSRLLMQNEGVLTVAIDDNELFNLGQLVQYLFPEHNLTTVTVVHNPRGNITNNFSQTHEYALFLTRQGSSSILRTTKENTAPRKMRRWGEYSTRIDRPTMFYPIYVKDGEITRIGVVPDNDFHPASKNVLQDSGEIEIWPIDQHGIERRWNFGLDSVGENLNRIIVGEKNNVLDLFLSAELSVPKTVWSGGEYDAGKYGNSLVVQMVDHKFPFPKSINTVYESVEIVCRDDTRSVILDFFGGSGTTAHAVMNLNNADDGDRRYILVEMGDHFNSVLKPRIEKVAYADEWKDGKPVLPNSSQDREMTPLSTGQSHMFQYLRLESYDDTFHNIRFRENAGPQMSFWDDIDYLLGYMLDHETAGSPALLDIEQFKRPFAYKLLVTGDDGVLREQPVDLVTTFNFLLGLAVQTIRQYDDNGNPYIRVAGVTPEGSRVCVLWRNSRAVGELDAERDWVLANVLHNVTYDRLYVNGENVIPDALLIEDAFKRRMFEGVN